MFGVSKEKFNDFAEVIHARVNRVTEAVCNRVHKETFDAVVNAMNARFDSIDTLIRRSIAGALKKDEVVTCEVCGCLVLKADAIRGESRIEASPFKTVYGGSVFRRLELAPTLEEKIVTPHLCRLCNAKKAARIDVSAALRDLDNTVDMAHRRIDSVQENLTAMTKRLHWIEEKMNAPQTPKKPKAKKVRA